MAEARVFWVALWGKLRQGFAAPDRALSSALIAAGLLLLAVGLIWFSSLAIDQPTAQIIVYLIAVFELLLGLRVGMLRIGYRSDEYMISTSSRFWRRAINYLIPAICLPLPIFVAITANLVGLGWLGLVVGKALVLNAVMFFALGAIGGILIRRLTKRLFVRAALLVMSVIAIFVSLNTSALVFDPRLIFSNSYTTLLTVIIFELSVVAVVVVGIELMVGNITLTNRHFGRFYPILLSPHISGSGPGSTAFFLTIKSITRDSLVHRRLAAIVFGYIVVLGLLYNYAGLLEPVSVSGLVLSLFAVFGGSAVFVVSQNLHLKENLKKFGVVAAFNYSRLASGVFLGGLFWAIIAASVLWGVADITFGAGQWAYVLVMAVVTQYTLASGWSEKLITSRHQTLSTLTVFGMIILIGLVPALLWNVITVNQILFVQLIWLILTVILLQLTNRDQRTIKYA